MYMYIHIIQKRYICTCTYVQLHDTITSESEEEVDLVGTFHSGLHSMYEFFLLVLTTDIYVCSRCHLGRCQKCSKDQIIRSVEVYVEKFKRS